MAKRHGLGRVRVRPCRYARGCQRGRVAYLAPYVVVQGAGAAGWRRSDRTNLPQIEANVKGGGGGLPGRGHEWPAYGWGDMIRDRDRSVAFVVSYGIRVGC